VKERTKANHRMKKKRLRSLPPAETEEEKAQLETQIDEDDGESVGRFAWAAPCAHADRREWLSTRLLIRRLCHYGRER